MKKWIIAIAGTLAVCLLLSGLCYVDLGSLNFVRTGMALSNVMMGGGVYQIADRPEKVWLSGSREEYRTWLEEEGYTFIDEDQMGSRIPVEKDGVRDYVYWSVNAMYHKWTWETANEPARGAATDPAEPESLYFPGKTTRYLYLYPETATEIAVSVETVGMTFAYPSCSGIWRVTAQPDGTLNDGARTVRSLCREGVEPEGYPMEQGFCVAGADTAAFLEEAAAKLGLTEQETQDFVLCFAPRMAENSWNLISFHVSEEGPDITPVPDTRIRVCMIWKPLGEAVQIAPQPLTGIRRSGFTALELAGGAIE